MFYWNFALIVQPIPLHIELSCSVVPWSTILMNVTFEPSITSILIFSIVLQLFAFTQA